jgi:hypothetical protein
VFVGKGRVVEAVYIRPELPKFDGNPCILAMPRINTSVQATTAMQRFPEYKRDPRRLPPHLRTHAAMDLLHFFQPLPIHLRLEGMVSRMIRDGYLARNPLDPIYRGNLRERLACFQDGRTLGTRYEPTASGFSVVGMSGVGKSTGVRSVLSLYDQVILHNRFKGRNFTALQVVWLKLECPKDGSLKALCVEFFEVMDDLLGTNYTKDYAKKGCNIHELTIFMAIVAAEHHLGVLVIDEIQDLSVAKSGGAAQVLNFFVKLINTIGLPVILIGTYKAIPIISSEFRLARRGSGQGDLVWDRMSYAELPNKKKPADGDEDWTTFLEQLWDLQYVKKACPLTNELSESLYEVSYGITDLAIRIYLAAQVRAIETGQEEITADLIRSAYRDDFRLVNRILETLKSGDISPLPMLEDVLPPAIQPIHSQPPGDGRDEQKTAPIDPPSSQKTPSRAGAKSTTDGSVRRQSSTRKTASGRDSINPRMAKAVKSSSKKKRQGIVNYEPKDLRGVVLGDRGTPSPLDAYQALKEASYIQAASEFL